MSSSWIDITRPLVPGMAVWPGSRGFAVETYRRMVGGEGEHVSELRCDLHVGTHVDAPWHFLEGGERVEGLALDRMMGLVWVEDCGGVGVITAEVLAGLPEGERVLFKTRNSFGGGAFDVDFVALSGDAARWLVGRGVGLVGVDGPSVQRYGDGPEVHRVLLGAGVVVLEGLDLSCVESGWHELICLPMALTGVEAAPVRAVLRRAESSIRTDCLDGDVKL